MRRKALFIILIICVLFTVTYRNSIYDKYLDLRYGRLIEHFVYNEYGDVERATSPFYSDYYWLVRLDEERNLIGKVKAYYSSNDQLMWETEALSYDPFIPHGIFKFYHPNGLLNQFMVMDSGLMNGAFMLYDSLGNLMVKGNYKSDLTHGLFTYGSETVDGRLTYFPDEINYNDTLILSDFGLTGLMDSFSEHEIRSIGSYVSQGDTLFKYGYYEDASERYSKALEIYPNLPDLQGKLGEVFYKLNESDNAIQYLESSLVDGGPETYYRRYLLGMLNYENKSYSTAKHHLNILSAEYPLNPQGNITMASGYNYLGLIAIEESKLKEAETLFELSFNLNPNDIEPEINRAYVNLKFDTLYTLQKTLIIGANILQDTISSIDQSQIRAIMAEAYFKLGDYSQAEEEMCLALRLDSLNQIANALQYHLFKEVYSGPLSDNAEMVKMLMAISVGALVIEGYSILRLVSVGRYLAASRELAFEFGLELALGSAIDELLFSETIGNQGSIEEINSDQLRSIEYLNSAHVSSAPNNHELFYRWKEGKELGFNYQGISEYNNQPILLMGRLPYQEPLIQSYLSGNSSQDVIDLLSELRKIDSRYFPAYIDYAYGMWHLGALSYNNFEFQYVKAQSYIEASEELRELTKNDFRVLDADYGDGTWMFVLSKQPGPPYHVEEQHLQVYRNFPGEQIKYYWSEGFFITLLKYTERGWLLCMSRHKDKDGRNIIQRLIKGKVFPVDLIAKYENAGFKLMSMTYSDNDWIILLMKSS